MFLDAPNTFIESHVCLSAAPFTHRIPPGQCQFQATGAAAGSCDIALPPSSFPLDLAPFDDPLGAFCAQVHVKYSSPGLALTRLGGGSAFAGLGVRESVLRQHLLPIRPRSGAPR
jgi:hypothetical protein